MENPKAISVQVEGDLYEQFMKTLPRSISFGDKVREWMLKELDSINMEKNAKPNTDPLNLSRPLTNTRMAETSMNTRTLDLYEVSELEAVQHICHLIEIGDWNTILMLNPKALKIHHHCARAIQKKNGMTPEKIQMLKSMEREHEPTEYHVPMGLD
jgi:hypothetical protein